METPSSIARIPIIPMSKKRNESESAGSRSRNVKALIDITNNSPIVGLAMGTLENPSSLSKKTPGSGEALLRHKVKTLLLLQVEEEAELSKISFNRCPTGIHQDTMVNDESKQETLDTDKSLTRSLLFDFLEKSEISETSSCSSVLTFQQGSSACVDKSNEEQVEQEFYNDEYENGQNGGLVDELCDGLSKMFVLKKKVLEFQGKHTRFVYNSDDEIQGEEEVGQAVSPSALHLKGLPEPEGKHLRFSEEEQE